MSWLAHCSQVAGKIRRVRFRRTDQIMLVAKHVPTHNQPAALRAALPRVQPLRTPHNNPPQLVLHSFTMSPELAAEMAHIYGLGWQQLSMYKLIWPDDVILPTLLPHLQYLGLHPDHVLDDALLSTLVTSVSQVNYMLYVRRVLLHTELPEGVDLPFDAIRVRDTNPAELVQNAEILGAGVEWSCKEFMLGVEPHQVCVRACVCVCVSSSRAPASARWQHMWLAPHVTHKHGHASMHEYASTVSGTPCVP